MSQPLDLPEDQTALPADCARHCEACKHVLRDLQRGTICELTNEKPSFTKLCPTFQFADNVPARLADMEHALDSEELSKTHINGSLIQYGGMGGLAVVGGIAMVIWLWGAGFVAWLPFAIIAVGIGAIAKGLADFSGGKEARDEMLQKRDTLQALLKAYAHTVNK